MPRAVRYGNTRGRVDKTPIGEANKRTRNSADAEEIWVEPAPHRAVSRKPSTRELDPKRVSQAYVAAFAALIDIALFTPEEVCAVLHISRATYYRHRDELARLRTVDTSPEEGDLDEWDE